MTGFRSLPLPLALGLLVAVPAFAQQAAPVSATLPAYADTADLVLGSPLILDGVVKSAAHIKGAEAANVAPGHARYYVTLMVQTLIKGKGGVPPQVGYVVDLPLDADGRAPKLKNLRVIAFARPVAGRPGQVQLTAPDAQQDWSPALDARIRAIASEAVAASAPPIVTGVGDAFHVPGALPGEGETQIFLKTAGGDPITLSIITRPNLGRHWAVALGDIVDDSAKTPQRDTLFWYRLACALPTKLPEASVADQSLSNAVAARDDYRYVLTQLGPCRPADDQRAR